MFLAKYPPFFKDFSQAKHHPIVNPRRNEASRHLLKTTSQNNPQAELPKFNPDV